MKKRWFCEICSSTDIETLVYHHIQSRSKGGSNDKRNIACICSNCHAKVHHGLIIIEGRFNSTAGKIIIHRSWDEKPIITESTPDIWLYPNARVNELRKLRYEKDND